MADEAVLERTEMVAGDDGGPFPHVLEILQPHHSDVAAHAESDKVGDTAGDEIAHTIYRRLSVFQEFV